MISNLAQLYSLVNGQPKHEQLWATERETLHRNALTLPGKPAGELILLKLRADLAFPSSTNRRPIRSKQPGLHRIGYLKVEDLFDLRFDALFKDGAGNLNPVV